MMPESANKVSARRALVSISSGLLLFHSIRSRRKQELRSLFWLQINANGAVRRRRSPAQVGRFLFKPLGDQLSISWQRGRVRLIGARADTKEAPSPRQVAFCPAHWRLDPANQVALVGGRAHARRPAINTVIVCKIGLPGAGRQKSSGAIVLAVRPI